MAILRMISIVTGTLVVLTVGCHSVSLKAPNVDRNAEIRWQKTYVWSIAHRTTDTLKACENLKELSSDIRFPAHDLARLRALEICSAETAPVIDRQSLPPYLQELAINVMLTVATSRQDVVQEMNLAAEKSRQKLPQSEKIQWMRLALQRANELKDTERVEEFSQRLYALAPRLNPSPKPSQFLSVANDYRLAREFPKARQYYEKVLLQKNSSLDDKISAYKGMRLSHKNVRDHDAHLAASNRYIKFLRAQSKLQPRSKALQTALYDAEVYQARAMWTLGHAGEAKKSFDLLEKRLKGKVSLAELYWLKGRLAEESDGPEAVSRYLKQASLEKTDDLELRDKILWYNAWNERRRKNLPQAIEVLRQMDSVVKADFTRARVLYWLGRSLTEDGKVDEGKEVFGRLLVDDPLGYYGLLAHHQLNVPITFDRSKNRREPTAESNIPLDAVTAKWLAALNEPEALTSMLNLASAAYRQQANQTDEGWVQIFQHYARAGLYMKLYESLSSLTPTQRKGIFEHYPELLFPQPWLSDAKTAATQFGIQENLIYAIIRQESAFDVHARSFADAFGVMQLLPEVAEQLSQRYKIPYSTMEDLYDPKTNMLLGAAHLKELFDRQKGRFILAVASYNASENVIHNWMKSRFRGDAQEFIEDIPYEETRAYVRLVIRNLAFYDLLKSKSSEIAFPAWVLNLGE